MARIATKPQVTIYVEVSEQSWQCLRELAGHGIYGATPVDVAARFIDEGIGRFAAHPILRLEPPAAPRRKRP